MWVNSLLFPRCEDGREILYLEGEESPQGEDGLEINHPERRERRTATARSLHELAAFSLPLSTFMDWDFRQLVLPRLLIYSLSRAKASLFLDFKIGSTDDFDWAISEWLSKPQIEFRSHFLEADCNGSRGLPPPKVEIKYASLEKNGKHCTAFVCKMCFRLDLRTALDIFDYAINECESTWHVGLPSCSSNIPYRMSLCCQAPSGNESAASETFSGNLYGQRRVVTFEKTSSGERRGSLEIGRKTTRMLCCDLEEAVARMELFFWDVLRGKESSEADYLWHFI